jgi:hypothetical protein
MIWNLLKMGCLALYALAIAGWAGWLPPAWALTFERIAGALLLIHALELLFVMRHVRRYPGPLVVSIGLTLLFGLVHWKPLADAKS